MKVCSNCFSDSELKSFIEAKGSRTNCKVCGSEKIESIDLDELLDFFQELLGNFQKSKTGTPLKLKIHENWNFFSSIKVASKILKSVIHYTNTELRSINDLVEYSEEIILNYSYWDELREKLKWERRYLPDLDVIQDLGWDGFFNTQFELVSKDKLFRARVHHESGKPAYPPGKMMCPEPEITRGGRANPSGIPFLYLSDNEETVLYEVRASYLDELSIGEFRLKKEIEKIKIVDFTESTLLFQPGSITEIIKARLLRQRISLELSKPMRRYDTDIEYVPTQFICEYIKIFTGAGGIRFKSSLHDNGNNIVLFDQEKMECIKVTLKRVKTVNLDAVEI